MSECNDYKLEVAESWDESAATWNDDETVKLYCQKAYETLSNAVNLRTQTNILDFGCGTVWICELLRVLCL